MAGKLVAEEGPLRELVLSFDEGDQWTIGRDPDACQLLVEDTSVSRQHLLCKRVTAGILVSNLSHSNPSLINDELLIEPRLLVQDDLVKIGNNTFRFYMETGAQLYEEQPNGEHAVGNRIQSATTSEPVSRDTFTDTIFDDDEDVAEKGNHHLAKINFDLLDTGRWLLKVISGPNSGAEFSMQTANSYVIGTDPNTCDIVFYDTSVSRRHARVTVNADDSLSIEDLSSRNGTRVDGETLEGKRPLAPQTIITIGTTAFVIYDREGEMQTLIAPLLPSIVKVLQKEDAIKTAEPVHAESTTKEAASDLKEAPVSAKTSTHAPGTFLIVGILIGLFTLAAIGISTLFQEPPPVVEENVDTDKLLTEALVPFPAVKYSYNKAAGKVLLLGHVLTAIDRNQLLYNLQNLHFVKEIDDSGMIIDEYVWREANQLLSGNPKWQGINVHSPAAGQYVLTGYLQTRGQAEQVWEYMARNFPYIDMLENKIVVEEDVLNTVSGALRDKGLNNVSPQISVGELSLTGTAPADKFPVLEQEIASFKEMTGIRVVKNFVTESAHQESIVNISDRYLVSGSSLLDGNLSVIINGRILSHGDILDGMTITNIQSNHILLEKDGITYRIDYSK
jgi:type III secretion system YscD/HrpQ family protein